MGEVKQETLEESNVNSVYEMVGMISGNRSYESNQRIIRAYDDIMGKAVNDIGRV